MMISVGGGAHILEIHIDILYRNCYLKEICAEILSLDGCIEIILILMFSVLPRITPFEFDGPANAGDNIQLTCHVPKGDKPLQILWRFNGNIILPSSFGISTMMVGERANFLSIAHAQAVHSGDFSCIATNAAGSMIHTAELKVNGSFQFTAFKPELFQIGSLPLQTDYK
jgi:hypothetical protein